MNKKGQMMLMLGASIAMSGGMVSPDRHWIDDYPKDPVTPIPPGNSKEFFFDFGGMCTTKESENVGYVFKCYAINQKNAVRKFNKWKNDQP